MGFVPQFVPGEGKKSSVRLKPDDTRSLAAFLSGHARGGRDIAVRPGEHARHVRRLERHRPESLHPPRGAARGAPSSRARGRPRPVVLTQPFERGRMQALRVDPVFAAERVDEMLRQQFDVFRPLDRLAVALPDARAVIRATPKQSPSGERRVEDSCWGAEGACLARPTFVSDRNGAC